MMDDKTLRSARASLQIAAKKLGWAQNTLVDGEQETLRLALHDVQETIILLASIEKMIITSQKKL